MTDRVNKRGLWISIFIVTPLLVANILIEFQESRYFYIWNSTDTTFVAELASNLDDPQICNRIRAWPWAFLGGETVTSSRIHCFTKLAKLEGDPEICDNFKKIDEGRITRYEYEYCQRAAERAASQVEVSVLE
jgi:hypothetical protein